MLESLRERLRDVELPTPVEASIGVAVGPSADAAMLLRHADLAMYRALLDTIQQGGIGVAIDDFGTGYSSLAYLADLPLDRIKLDQSFVQRIHHARITTLVRGLVHTVHELGYEVVAEGVEDHETASALSELGVAWQQGFLYSRPLDSRAAGRWLRDHRRVSVPEQVKK